MTISFLNFDEYQSIIKMVISGISNYINYNNKVLSGINRYINYNYMVLSGINNDIIKMKLRKLRENNIKYEVC